MRFVDCVSLHLVAGHGGAGAIAYRKEKFMARGGPFGGNGGKGADIVFEASRNVGTLLDLRYRKEVLAPRGESGGTKRQDGAQGVDVVIKVPVGTLVRDAHTRAIVADLAEDGDRKVIVRGGKGGLGNAAFKNAVRQTPHFAQSGLPGDSLDAILELKLLADIGIIGYPSVGKSTLISVISNARPRIAAYHFTTLIPNLGIVKYKNYRSFVVADIPGLIEGAHAGRGLGYRFLRHIERCRALVHLIEVPLDDGSEADAKLARDPIGDFDAICHELQLFSSTLAQRPQIVVLGKMDQPYVAEQEPRLRAHFEGLGFRFFAISSATRDGLDTLVDAMMELVDTVEPPDSAHFTVPDEDELRAGATEMDWETGKPLSDDDVLVYGQDPESDDEDEDDDEDGEDWEDDGEGYAYVAGSDGDEEESDDDESDEEEEDDDGQGGGPSGS
jgi:GTP-binding protein